MTCRVHGRRRVRRWISFPSLKRHDIECSGTLWVPHYTSPSLPTFSYLLLLLLLLLWLLLSSLLLLLLLLPPLLPLPLPLLLLLLLPQQVVPAS